MAKSKQILSEEEKNEIVSDVKTAFTKAQNKITNHTKKRPKLVIFITVLIILSISILGISWYLSNNPKVIFTESINTIFNTLNQNIKETSYDLQKGKVDISYIKTTSTNENQILKVNSDYKIDRINKISETNLKIDLNDNKQELSLNKENKKLYIKKDSKDEKYIQINNDFKYNYEPKEIKKVLNFINEALNNSIEGQKIFGSKTDVKINNKNINTYKTSLVLNSENINLVLNKIETNLKGQNDFIKSYSNIKNVDEEIALNAINEDINNLKAKYKDLDSLTINIYTKGVNYEFVKLEILKEKNNQTDLINITNSNKNTYNYLFDLKSENIKKEGTIKFSEKQNKNIYNISETSDNGSIVTQKDLNINIIEKISLKQIEKIKEPLKFDLLNEEEKNKVNDKIKQINEIAEIILK